MFKNLAYTSFFYFAFNSVAFLTPLNLAPHRAVYDLSLVQTNNNKKIESANGRVALEFSGNACQGFNFLSRQITNMSDGEGGNKQVDVQVQNWESPTGNDLKFKSITREGNMTVLQSEGRARRDKSGELSISLHRPQLLKLDTDGKALFPTAYMHKLIEAGVNGDNFFSVKTYDGSDEGTKFFDTAAIIGKEIPAGSDLRTDEIMHKIGIKNMRRWPVQVSYYEDGKGENLPVYKLSYDLFENGISTSLVYDFGNVVLKGQLTHIDLLPQKACAK